MNHLAIISNKNRFKSKDQGIVRLLNASYADGVIYCQVERDAMSEIKGRKFDLHKNEYNILLATGTSLKENKVGYHDIRREASEVKYLLSKPKMDAVTVADPIYNGCGVNKTCFGIPNNCVASLNCQAFMSMAPNGDKYLYEMKSPTSSKYSIPKKIDHDLKKIEKYYTVFQDTLLRFELCIVKFTQQLSLIG